MLDREAAEALFLKHLGVIDKIALIACGKHGIRGGEAEDFVASVRMLLMQDDYAIVRRFRGESEIRTYLTTIISRHLLDFERARRGRWRPSAAAERLGPPAPELERLVRHGGYTVQQAGERLRTSGRTTLSDAELARLLDRVPERPPLRPRMEEPSTGLDAMPGTARADDRVNRAEDDQRRAEMMGALRAALDQLEPEERVIVLMHFAEGKTVANVARALGLEQKPLYRRVDRLRARLRALLEAAGWSADEVGGLLHEPDPS